MKRINSKPIWFSAKTKALLVWHGIKPLLILLSILVVVQFVLTMGVLIVMGEDYFDNGLYRFVLFVASYVIAATIDEIRQQIIAVNQREKKIIDIWVETQKPTKKRG